MTIKLIVGLGNPGPRYEQTRHNAGAWLVEKISKQSQAILKVDAKFKAQIGKGNIANQTLLLCIPTTFMNLSGEAVSSIAKFYKIDPSEILVAYDEIDLPPGVARIKLDGGHGGHNGLRDIFARLGTKAFYRLRIGVGRPGHKDDVSDYVLCRPSKSDQNLIDRAIDNAIDVLPQIVNGSFEQAMNILHTES